MSYSIADIEYVNAIDLGQWLRQGDRDGLGRRVQVVDVRGHDHIGGHIRGSINIPSHQFAAEMDSLEQQLDQSGTQLVVFHCAHSQQRGPRAALAFLRHTNGKFAVKVLTGGFYEWQQRYGTDPNLTSAYVPDLWV